MENMIDRLIREFLQTIQTLPENEIFIGLIFAGGISTLMYLSRGIPRLIIHKLKNTFALQITFPTGTTNKVLEFIESLPTVIGPKSFDISMGMGGSEKRLGSGIHLRRYGHVLLYSKVTIKYSEYIGDRYIELHVSLITKRRSILDSFLEDLHDFHYKGSLKIFVPDGFRWRLQKATNPREWDTLVFPNTIKEDVVNDIKWWKSAQSTYERLGIPYRRGYLFYGEPGTGKSSLITLLGTYLTNGIYYFDLRSPRSNEQLLELFSEVAPNSLVVIEDIDTFFDQESRGLDVSEVKNLQNEPKRDSVSFSSLLNVLDGLLASENFILIFTTNHPEKLNSALIRPGRIDRKFKFEKLDFSSLKTMAQLYGCDLDDSTLYSWVPISPAEAQVRLLSTSEVIKNENT